MTSRATAAKKLNLSILAPKALYLSILNTLGFAEGIAASWMSVIQDAQDVHVLGAWRRRVRAAAAAAVSRCDALRMVPSRRWLKADGRGNRHGIKHSLFRVTGFSESQRMSHLAEQTATTGHTLAHMANLLARAEGLCHTVAGPDLAGVPLYIVAQSILPADCGSGDHCYGYTLPSLDIYLADHIPSYRGRGPCVVINDVALADDFDPDDLKYVVPSYVLHELGHVLDRPALFEDRTGVDPDKLLFESLVVADCTKRPPRDDIPLYHGHEVGFIRIALHLCHRAERAGVSIAPAAICAGHRYGLSHASDYQDALGDEPARCTGMPFHDIAATAPPPAFTRLWTQDIVSYHNRFSHLKGVSR
jgi:hypothetical protein